MNPADDSAAGYSLAARVALALGLAVLAAGLAAFFWYVSHGVLVMFSAVIFAVALDGPTALICRFTRLPRGPGLALTVVLIAMALGAILWTGGMRVANQGPELRQGLERSVEQLQRRLQEVGLSVTAGGGPSAGSLVKKTVTEVLTSQTPLSETMNLATDLLVIVVAGVYFAANPRLYTETAVTLFPPGRRKRLRQVQAAAGVALRRWVAGRLAAMVSVGVMTTIGMLLLNVHLALLLGFIAGLLTFVPYLGTVISLIPALLIALLNGPATALYVALLYFGAHLVEGYVLTPLIQAEAVRLAPSWLVMAQVFGWLLAGIFGMALATPVAVVVTIGIQMLYVQDVLGDYVRPLGE